MHVGQRIRIDWMKKEGSPVFEKTLYCGKINGEHCLARTFNTDVYIYRIKEKGGLEYVYKHSFSAKILDMVFSEGRAVVMAEQLVIVIRIDGDICVEQEFGVNVSDGLGMYRHVIVGHGHLVVGPVRGVLEIHRNYALSDRETIRLKINGVVWKGAVLSRSVMAVIVHSDADDVFYIEVYSVKPGEIVLMERIVCGYVPVGIVGRSDESFIVFGEVLDRFHVFERMDGKYVGRERRIVLDSEADVDVYRTGPFEDAVIRLERKSWKRDARVLGIGWDEDRCWIVIGGCVVVVDLWTLESGYKDISGIECVDDVVGIGNGRILVIDSSLGIPTGEERTENAMCPWDMWKMSTEQSRLCVLVLRYHGEYREVVVDVENGRCWETESRFENVVDIVEMGVLDVVVEKTRIVVFRRGIQIQNVLLGFDARMCSGDGSSLGVLRDGAVAVYGLQDALCVFRHQISVDTRLATCMLVSGNLMCIGTFAGIVVCGEGEAVFVDVEGTPSSMRMHESRLVVGTVEGRVCSYDTSTWTHMSQAVGNDEIDMQGQSRLFLKTGASIYEIQSGDPRELSDRASGGAGYWLRLVLARSIASFCVDETLNTVFFVEDDRVGIVDLDGETRLVPVLDRRSVEIGEFVVEIRGNRLDVADAESGEHTGSMEFAEEIEIVAGCGNRMCVSHGNQISINLLEKDDVVPLDVLCMESRVTALSTRPSDRDPRIMDIAVGHLFGQIRVYEHLPDGHTALVCVDRIFRSVSSLMFLSSSTVVGIEHCGHGRACSEIVRLDVDGSEPCSESVRSIEEVAAGFSPYPLLCCPRESGTTLAAVLTTTFTHYVLFMY